MDSKEKKLHRYLQEHISQCWGDDLNTSDCIGYGDKSLKTYDKKIRSKFKVSHLEELFFVRDTSAFKSFGSGCVITEKGIHILDKDALFYEWETLERVEDRGISFIFYSCDLDDKGEHNSTPIPQKTFIKTGNPSSALKDKILRLFRDAIKIAKEDPVDAIKEEIKENEADPHAVLKKATEYLNEAPLNTYMESYLKFEIGRSYFRLNDYGKAKKYLREVAGLTSRDMSKYCTWANFILGDIFAKEEDFKQAREKRFVASKGDPTVLLDGEPIHLLAKEALDKSDANYFSSLKEHSYAEHKLIYPVEDLSKLSALSQNQMMVVSLQTLRQVNLDFPMGHPMAKQLYVCHPYIQNKFIPYENYELEFLENRIREFCEIAQCLGAKSIKIKANNEESKDEKSSIDGSIGVKGGNKVNFGSLGLHGKTSENVVAQLRNSMSFEQDFFPPTEPPHIPEDTVWLKTEPSWNRLIRQCMRGNLNHHKEIICLSKSRVIDGNALLELNAEVKTVVADVGLDFSVEKSNNLKTTQDTSLRIEVDFYTLENTEEQKEISTVVVTKDNKTSFFKRLFLFFKRLFKKKQQDAHI